MIGLNRTSASILVLAFCVAVYLIPSPIDPKPFRFESPPKLKGPLSQNKKLQAVEKLFEGLLIGPESFASGENGTIYTGTSDGKIWKINGSQAEEIARVGIDDQNCGTFDLEPECGRPKGLKLDKAGNLLVADAYKGILKIDTIHGKVETLVQGVDGKPFKFLNGLDISSDGIVYFTDSSLKWDRRNHRYEVIETNNHGKLLSFNPVTKETKVLLNNLYLANGVAVSACGTFLLVVEMSVCQIRKYYIKGPRSGQSEVIITNLPGYPDNIKLNSKGTYYVGMATVRFDGLSRIPPFLDLIGPYPALKRFIAKVTPFAIYNIFVPKYGMLLEMDSDGRLINSFQDPDGTVVTAISEGYEHDGHLLLGHFGAPYLLRADLKTLYA